MSERKKPKPRRWKRGHDGKCCLACEKAFVRGDDVYEIGACCIHEGYVQQCKELGMTP